MEDFGGALGLVRDSRACGWSPSPAAGLPYWAAAARSVTGSTIRAATPGSGWPTVPGLLPVCVSRPALKFGRVDGHDRRHLGAAVAFEQIDAEFFAERGGHAARAVSRRPPARSAGWRILRRCTCACRWRRRSGVESSSVALYFCDQLADGRGVGRVGMVDHAAAGEQREPDGHGEAEGMEEGQHADDAVAASRSRRAGRWLRCRRSGCSARA